MNFAVKQFLKFILTAIGIVFVGCLPNLFNGMKIDFGEYLSTVRDVFIHLPEPFKLQYLDSNMISRPLFPEIWGPYIYSMKILLCAIMLAVILSLLFTYITFFLPGRLQKFVKFLAFIGESLPDLFVIIVFQIAVIWVFQKTGILLMQVEGAWQSDIFIMPVLCLSILPTFFFYRMLVLTVEEQFGLDYIEFAKSKGVKKHKLLLRHISRNVAAPMLIYSKTIVWMLLSNLLIFEFLFNIDGITMFMYNHPRAVIFSVSLLMIFVPVFLIYSLIAWLIGKTTSQKVVV